MFDINNLDKKPQILPIAEWAGVIKGREIVTPTGHFNVYNTTHDIY